MLASSATPTQINAPAGTPPAGTVITTVVAVAVLDPVAIGVTEIATIYPMAFRSIHTNYDNEIVSPAELITSDAPTTTVCAVANVPYHNRLPPFAAVVTVSNSSIPVIVA